MAASQNRTSGQKRLFFQIAEGLERRIASGEFGAGERLPSERVLGLEFNASRTSVREAILLLQSRGLLSKKAKSRTRVTTPSSTGMMDHLSSAARSLLSNQEGVANLQEARSLLECGLGRYAARHATPKQIERLQIALEENEKHFSDPDAFTRTDIEFHLTIARIPANPIFVSLHQALLQWLVTQRTVGIKIPGSSEVMFQDHKAIYQAIASRDPEAADQAMSNHLAHVARYYWKAVTDGSLANSPNSARANDSTPLAAPNVSRSKYAKPASSAERTKR